MMLMIYMSTFASITLFIWGLSRFRFRFVKLEDAERQLKLQKGLLFRMLKPLIQIIAHMLQKRREEKINRKYFNKLLISGNELNLLPVEFVALKILSAVAGAGVGGFLILTTQLNFFAVIVFGCLAYYYPDLWLHDTTIKRKHIIAKDLPYCMDLMTLAVEAGASFQGAIEKVVTKGVKGPLANELEKMLQDLRLGLARNEALTALAKRTDLYAIRSFTSALIQADKLGTPLGKSLRTQSDLRRTERFHKLEKLAQEAPVKLLMPLMMFILPSVFIVILGPMALKFMAEGM